MKDLEKDKKYMYINISWIASVHNYVDQTVLRYKSNPQTSLAYNHTGWFSTPSGAVWGFCPVLQVLQTGRRRKGGLQVFISDLQSQGLSASKWCTSTCAQKGELGWWRTERWLSPWYVLIIHTNLSNFPWSFHSFFTREYVIMKSERSRSCREQALSFPLPLGENHGWPKVKEELARGNHF